MADSQETSEVQQNNPEEQIVELEKQNIQLGEQLIIRSEELIVNPEEQNNNSEKQIIIIKPDEPIIRPEEHVIGQEKESTQLDEFNQSWNSEAGPVITMEKIFEDPAACDFLALRGNNTINSSLSRRSLLTLFDPLISSDSQGQNEEHTTASVKMADKNSGDENEVQSMQSSPMPFLCQSLIQFSPTLPQNRTLEPVVTEASPNVPRSSMALIKLKENLMQLEKQFKEKIEEIKESNKNQKQKSTKNGRVSMMLEDYQETISSMNAQKEVWISKKKVVERERDSTIMHLSHLETVINDVDESEKTKAVLSSFNQIEGIFNSLISEYDVAIKKQEKKIKTLELAKSQLEKAYQKSDNSQEADPALQKKAEEKTSPLKEAFEPKTKVNHELMRICEELIN